MSLNENRPKVHSNYRQAVMQGQRPFRFALIVDKNYKPISKYVLQWRLYHKELFLQGNLTTFSGNGVSEKRICPDIYMYNGWDRLNLVVSPM